MKNVLDEKNMLDLLKNQVNNMSHTLKEAENGGEKMLPVWFAVVYYEADQIKMAIDSYFKLKEGSGFEMCKAIQEAQLANIKRKNNEEEKTKKAGLLWGEQEMEHEHTHTDDV